MTMELSDRDLLSRFATQHDEFAFNQLVRRHIDLVHATARRITGREDLASDAAQNTFIRLARQAAHFPNGVAPAAWLHRTCRSLAIDLVRAETRRQKHEAKAAADPAVNHDSGADPSWLPVSRVVDSLVDQLNSQDREILLLRYFENQTCAAAGRTLGLREQAARKRAERALDRLRDLLRSRGITTTSAALAMLLPSCSSKQAPSGLATTISKTAGGIKPIAGGFLAKLAAVTVTQGVLVGVSVSILVLGGIVCSERWITSKQEPPGVTTTTTPVASAEVPPAVHARKPASPPQATQTVTVAARSRSFAGHAVESECFTLTPDKKTMTREVFDPRGAIVLTIVYRMEDSRAVNCDVFNAEGAKICHSRYGYSRKAGSPSYGKLVEEQILSSRIKHVDPNTGAEMPLRRVIYSYNPDGSANPPIPIDLVKDVDIDAELEGVKSTGLNFDPFAGLASPGK